MPPRWGEGQPRALVQPAAASTYPLQRPVLSVLPPRVETTDWRQDRKDTMYLRLCLRRDSRRLHSKPLRACRPWAEAGLCHTALSSCSPISSFLAQHGPAIFIFFMGLSNLLQMSSAGCNAFLLRKLFFFFSNLLVDLLGWVTVLH